MMPVAWSHLPTKQPKDETAHCYQRRACQVQMGRLIANASALARYRSSAALNSINPFR
jgi:hypothetical protein